MRADKPRVLHIVPTFFDKEDGILGGAERYAYELARFMAERVPTRLLTFGSVPREEMRGALSLRVIGNPWRVRGEPHNPFSLAILPEIRRVDVVHCHQQRQFVTSMAALASRATGRRVFVSSHGGGGWDISAFVSTTNWFHGHLHVSEFSRRIYGRAEPRACVVYGGVDTERFSPDPSVPKDGTVLFVGRLLPHKGVEVILEAIDESIPVEIIGQPASEKYVEGLRELAAGKNVRFRQDLDEQALVHAYRKAMCVVLPSVYRNRFGADTRVPELLGQTLLEGMATGIPGISSDAGSLPEVVDDGVTGFVTPVNDSAALGEKLRWLRNHPEEASKMGEAARRRVLEKFDWPAIVDHCLAIYEGRSSSASALDSAAVETPLS